MPQTISIGILALQGAFSEHETSLHRVSSPIPILTVQVRTKEDLLACDALVIPGGESTTIALIAKRSGLLEPLREFVKTKPVWGTCAGAILLSQVVEGAKKGGQELLGGISITIERNGWGSQVESFEAQLMVEGLRNPTEPFQGIFIRAPVIRALHRSKDDIPIRIVARLPSNVLPQAPLHGHQTVSMEEARLPALDIGEDPKTIVALRQGHHLLTTFHPELTRDNRFHEYFVKECVIPVFPTVG